MYVKIFVLTGSYQMRKSSLTAIELFNLLTKYVDAFYNTSTKLITDEEYDELKDLYESKFNKKFTIGSKIKIEQTVNVSHSYKNLAGTLDKINYLDEFKAWLKRKNVINNVEIFLSYKIDGNSLILEYDNGKLIKALTRGEEGVGKDLTSYFNNTLISGNKSIKQIKGIKGKFGIACECCILYEDFEAMINNGEASYNNPRSAVPGILSEDGVVLSEYLSIIPFKIITEEKLSREENIKLINSIQSQFNTTNFQIKKVKVSEVANYYNDLVETRFQLPFMIDGLVLELTDEKLRNSLGYSDNRPNYAIAFKLPYIEAKTKLLNLEWFTEGNSARYTPVVYFEVVNINNNDYQKVSLSNYKRFNSLHIHKNQEAIFTLRGDVLGYIDPVPSDSKKVSYFKPITHCKFCGNELQLCNNSVFLFCNNNECELVILGTLQNFLEKHNIKGIKRNTLKTLYDNKLLTKIEDFFSLDYNKAKKIKGMGESSVNNIQEALLYFKQECWDYKLLGSLNIPFFSVRRAEQLLQCITFNEFLDLILKEDSSELISRMSTFKGFKEKILNHIYNGFTDSNLLLLSFLIDNIPIKYSKLKSESTEKVFNICVTGKINLFKNRKVLESMLIDKGHKLVDKVTSTTDILMTNDPNTSTDKNIAAKKLGTRVISEEELIILFELAV